MNDRERLRAKHRQQRDAASSRALRREQMAQRIGSTPSGRDFLERVRRIGDPHAHTPDAGLDRLADALRASYDEEEAEGAAMEDVA